MNWQMQQINWESEARRILKAEMARRGMTYQELAGLLQRSGISETERSIGNKMSRGTFQFTFVLQCTTVLGINDIHVQLATPTHQDVATVGNSL
jgi:hypothetical protein